MELYEITLLFIMIINCQGIFVIIYHLNNMSKHESHKISNYVQIFVIFNFANMHLLIIYTEICCKCK